MQERARVQPASSPFLEAEWNRLVHGGGRNAGVKGMPVTRNYERANLCLNHKSGAAPALGKGVLAK